MLRIKSFARKFAARVTSSVDVSAQVLQAVTTGQMTSAMGQMPSDGDKCHPMGTSANCDLLSQSDT